MFIKFLKEKLTDCVREFVMFTPVVLIGLIVLWAPFAVIALLAEIVSKKFYYLIPALLFGGAIAAIAYKTRESYRIWKNNKEGD